MDLGSFAVVANHQKYIKMIDRMTAEKREHKHPFKLVLVIERGFADPYGVITTCLIYLWLWLLYVTRMPKEK